MYKKTKKKWLNEEKVSDLLFGRLGLCFDSFGWSSW